MHSHFTTAWRTKIAVGASAAALSGFALIACMSAGCRSDQPVDAIKTATPDQARHHHRRRESQLRSFVRDLRAQAPRGGNTATCCPRRSSRPRARLVVHFARAHQYQITSAPNGGKFFSSADLKNKTLYSTLPPPDVGGVGAVSPYIGIVSLPGGDPGLPPADQFLFGTGGTGLSFTLGPDTRITNVDALPPGPFQMTGPTMPFDAFTGDTIHQYFQMVQQVDCAIDEEHVSRRNPTGCLHDLQSGVTTTYSTPPTGTPHDTGQTMAFFNMQQGDAPLFKSLADQYTMSDNYHQPVLGGTGPDSQPLGFADQVFFSDGNGNPATPAAANIYNPDPQAGTLNLYTQRAQWFNCSDETQPGIGAITSYLKSLPYTRADQMWRWCNTGRPSTSTRPSRRRVCRRAGWSCRRRPSAASATF